MSDKKPDKIELVQEPSPDGIDLGHPPADVEEYGGHIPPRPFTGHAPVQMAPKEPPTPPPPTPGGENIARPTPPPSGESKGES